MEKDMFVGGENSKDEISKLTKDELQYIMEHKSSSDSSLEKKSLDDFISSFKKE